MYAGAENLNRANVAQEGSKEYDGPHIQKCNVYVNETARRLLGEERDSSCTW